MLEASFLRIPCVSRSNPSADVEFIESIEDGCTNVQFIESVFEFYEHIAKYIFYQSADVKKSSKVKIEHSF